MKSKRRCTDVDANKLIKCEIKLRRHVPARYSITSMTQTPSMFDTGVVQANKPGRVAQSVGHLTRKSGVLGSIAGLATYFRFSFRFFSRRAVVSYWRKMFTKYWLTI